MPYTRDILLIGGGHTHALVLRKWGMSPLAGARLTVINPGPTAPYSGMLPGFVAGHYSRDDLDIDLVKLSRFAGARVILGAVDGINLDAGAVQVAGRPPIGFDVCSIDIGITSVMPDLPGFSEHGVPVKPLGPFSRHWDRFLRGEGPAQVVILGAGVAGAELAMAMAHALRMRERFGAVHLIDRGQALSVLHGRARQALLNALTKQGVTLWENTDVIEVSDNAVTLGDGQEIAAGFVTGAAGAMAYGWLQETDLELSDGFVAVDANLRSSDPRVFAVGDCAHLSQSPRPKAGVFAVRQAPVLFENLRATASGQALKTYRPQKDYLKLISLGDKSALAEKSGVPISGSLMWRWKDQIDQKFMHQFKGLHTDSAVDLPREHALGSEELVKPMCGGCGAKLGKTALSRAVAGLPKLRGDVHYLPGDDAAVLKIGEARQVVTTDHLRALTEDPGLMAEIAAVHALGDIWAMGAAPQAALAQIVLPRMSAALQERSLREIMQTAGRVFAAAGAEIVGGHSTMGSEMTIGFSLTGLCDSDPITLAGAKAGDALILTKPIGTGVLLAAEMAGQAKGAWVANAYQSMVQPQTRASELLRAAHAMTDVTGFGLAGHLQGICDASGVGAVLRLDRIPVLDGALALSDNGVLSSLFPDNRNLVPSLPDHGKARLLFDPQTGGGLLAAVSHNKAGSLCKSLQDQGFDAAIIGEMTDQAGRISLA